jgi:hypothetical protein
MKTLLKRRLVVVLSALALAACGGGSGAGTSVFGTDSAGTSGSSGTSTSTSTSLASPVVTLTLSSVTVTASLPSTVTVRVTDSAASGAAMASKIVNFSTASSLGAFSANSALTDANGYAQVTLSPAIGTASGADEVIASTTVNGTTVSTRVGFTLTASTLAIASLTTDVAASARLAAYGQTNVTATITGAASGTPVAVTLSSACVAKGKATINPSSYTTTTGVVSAVYKDAGCGATDTADTIQAVVTGSNASRSTSLTLTPPTVNSITFDQASPSVIYLRGSGLGESSTVSFKVVDTANNALPNQDVDLVLTTAAGGVTLDQLGTGTVRKRSDGDGKVTVQINSGTVPTPVRVSATLVGTAPAITTVSSQLTVAVGLPSQLNFSLSQGALNIEGYNRDGTVNTYTIIASDRSGNPVPVGTGMNFVTEGGQIEATKQIASVSGISRATANFVSAGTRPVDGRITITAYALGEESFLDSNGDNVWTVGEPFQDLGDVFKDRLFDGAYASDGTDEFVSLSISSAQSCAAITNSLLNMNASIPSRPGTCDAVWGKAYVRRATETVLSTSSSRLLWPWATPSAAASDACSIVNLQTGPGSVTSKFYQVADTELYGLPSLGTLSVVLADANPIRLNPMASGTTVTLTPSTGITTQMLGGDVVPSTGEATSAVFSYKFEAASSGTIAVKTTSPSGLTTATMIYVTTDPRPVSVAACSK